MQGTVRGAEGGAAGPADGGPGDRVDLFDRVVAARQGRSQRNDAHLVPGQSSRPRRAVRLTEQLRELRVPLAREAEDERRADGDPGHPVGQAAAVDESSRLAVDEIADRSPTERKLRVAREADARREVELAREPRDDLVNSATLDLERLPISLPLVPGGGPPFVQLTVGERDVSVLVRFVRVGRVPLLLLDTNVRSLDPATVTATSVTLAPRARILVKAA